MMTRYNKTVTGLLIMLAIIVVFGVTPSAHAANWFDKFSSSFVHNSDSAWTSQKMGHYSGGGVSFRMPVDRSPLFSITPPRIEAGCGGIDAFWGGFSFMTKEYLIQKLKNILQAAPAYAFNLALTHLCQTCKNILASLEAIANELNALALDDCKASAALVHGGAAFLTTLVGSEASQGDDTGGGANFLESILQKTSSGLASFRQDLNKFLDYRYGCGNYQGAARDECRKKYTLSGSIWTIAREMSNDRGSDYKINANYEQLVRGLYGDIVFKLPDEVAASSNSAKMATINRVAPCEGALNALIDAMVSVDDSSSDPKIKIKNDSGQCVEVEASSILSSEDFFFGQKAVAAVLEIQNAMYNGNAISDTTIQIINQSVVPIYNALNTMNLRKIARTGNKAKLSSEEEAMVKMLAASNALYILTSLHASAQELFSEAGGYAGSLMDNGPYDRSTFELAEKGMRASMAFVHARLNEKIEEARQAYSRSMDGIVKAHSMRTMFQVFLAQQLPF